LRWSYEGDVARWFMEDAVGAYREEERPLEPLRVAGLRKRRLDELLALSALPYPLLAALPYPDS